MDKQGSIGERHGEMGERVKNPFRIPFMRRNFDAAVEAYDAKLKMLIYEHGARCVGNGWAHHFWNGFDGVKQNYSGSKDTSGYAFYRAGQLISKELKRGEA